MLSHVLVTLDGSQLAEKALAYAQSILAPGGKLTLLNVVDMPEFQLHTFYELPAASVPGGVTQIEDQARQAAQDYLANIARELRSQDFRVDTITETGDPATVIVDEASRLGVDAIIMSTHGRTGISRWLFGSVTQKVLMGMPCPVFVVPGTEKVKSDEPAPVPQQRTQPAT